MSEIAVQRTYRSILDGDLFEDERRRAMGWGSFKPSDILRDAMAYLDQKGWCQGGLASKSGEVCGHGSIEVAHHMKRATLPWTVTRYENQFPSYFSLGSLSLDALPAMPKVEVVDNPDRQHLENAVGRAHEAIQTVARKAGWNHEGDLFGLDPDRPYKDAFAVFNDDPKTSIEDVVLMMKEAVAWLESQGE